MNFFNNIYLFQKENIFIYLFTLPENRHLRNRKRLMTNDYHDLNFYEL